MRDIICDMWRDGLVGRFMLALITLMILMIPLVIYGSIQEAERWALFKEQHECKIVGHERGHTSTGVAPIIGGNGGVGIVVTSTPDKTGWECNNGITYWR